MATAIVPDMTVITPAFLDEWRNFLTDDWVDQARSLLDDMILSIFLPYLTREFVDESEAFEKYASRFAEPRLTLNFSLLKKLAELPNPPVDEAFFVGALAEFRKTIVADGHGLSKAAVKSLNETLDYQSKIVALAFLCGDLPVKYAVAAFESLAPIGNKIEFCLYAVACLAENLVEGIKIEKIEFLAKESSHYAQSGLMRAREIFTAAWKLDAYRQLRDISALAPGWDGPDSKPIPSLVQHQAHALVDAAGTDAPVPCPWVSATASGQIEFHWRADNRTLEFTITADKIEVYAEISQRPVVDAPIQIRHVTQWIRWLAASTEGIPSHREVG